MVSPAQKRRAVQAVVATGLCSQRRACRYLELHRSSGRYRQTGPTEWLLRLHEQIEALSRKHPRLGYRKLTRLLRTDGWQAGKKLVQRIRRECGLRVKRWMKRPRRRGRSTGTIRRGPSGSTTSGAGLRGRPHRQWWATARPLPHRRYSRECLALHVARKLTAHDLIEVMERLVAERGAPEHIRSDNGSEFIARILQQWLAQRQVKTLYIEPATPGRTVTSRASTARCATNAWTVKSCSAWPRPRPHRGLPPPLQPGTAPWRNRLRTPAKPGAKLWAPVALRAPYGPELDPAQPISMIPT